MLLYFPVILDMEAPRVNAYSLETLIAEKLEAIIHNGYLNSRYKDFMISMSDAMDWIKAFVCPLLEGMEKTK